MAPERQRQVLFGLVAVLALVGAWQYVGESTPAATNTSEPTTRRSAPMQVPPPPVPVGLDQLAVARLGPEEGGRNPFSFGARSVPADDGPRSTGRPDDGDGVPPPALPPVAPTGPPPPAPIPLKFIGFVEGTSGTKRIAVLSDTKGLVVHGTEGAIIDGRYRILAIGQESIDLAYVDGRGRQTLRLTGQ